jgi:hypothetical protein
MKESSGLKKNVTKLDEKVTNLENSRPTLAFEVPKLV